MTRHDVKDLVADSSAETVPWELPVAPRNRVAAIAGGAVLAFGLLGNLIWRAYGPPYPARAPRSSARKAPPEHTPQTFVAPQR